MSNRKPPSQDALVNIHILRQECLKYTEKGKLRTNKVAARFDVDLTGWRYLRPGELEEATTTVKSQFGSRIDVEIFFRSQHDEWAGQWNRSSRTILLDAPSGDLKAIPTLPVFRTRMNSLLGTCWHECQHVGQDFLKFIRGLKEHAGLPSRDLRQPGITPHGTPDLEHIKQEDPRKYRKMLVRDKTKRIDHPLRDIEFYTNLGNDTRELRNSLEKVPPKRRHDFFKSWVGLAPKYDPWKDEPPRPLGSQTPPLQSARMLMLRDKAPEKWKKLVSELWKAVHDLVE
jgi:hypothetical protein